VALFSPVVIPPRHHNVLENTVKLWNPLNSLFQLPISELFAAQARRACPIVVNSSCIFMNHRFLLPLGLLLLPISARAQVTNIPLPPPTPLNGTDMASGSVATGAADTSNTAMIATKKAADYSDAELHAMGSSVAFPYELLDGFLHRYVDKKGNVYYLKAKGDNDLDTFARALAVADVSNFPVFTDPVDPADPTKGVKANNSAELTFDINAYNGLRLKTIADLYPRVSASDLASLDKTKNLTIGGRQTSFFELRQKIGKMDPRALFALMSGMQDGPTAPFTVYRFSGLGAQLNAAVRGFVNDPNKVSSPDRLANRVEVSPYLAEVDPFFKPSGSRRKNAGVRQVLSTFTSTSAAKGYFTTSEYGINFSQGNSKLNDHLSG